MKPPEFTSTRPATFSGWMMASRAAEKPPAEFPMKTAGGRFRAVTTSSRTSANREAVGCISGGCEEAPCQGQSMAMAW